MTTKKSYKPSDVVLVVSDGESEYAITAGSFNCVKLDGKEILSGEKYYIEKAVEYGAVKKKETKAKK